MRRFGLLLGAALVCAVPIFVVSRRLSRVAVSGHSMEPALRDGDWLIVDHGATGRVGNIVVAVDPRENHRVIIKRVKSTGTDSRLTLESDHPAHAGEEIGPVGPSDIVGRARMRYWPPKRAGRL